MTPRASRFDGTAGAASLLRPFLRLETGENRGGGRIETVNTTSGAPAFGHQRIAAFGVGFDRRPEQHLSTQDRIGSLGRFQETPARLYARFFGGGVLAMAKCRRSGPWLSALGNSLRAPPG